MKKKVESKGQGTEPTISSRESRLRRLTYNLGYGLHKSSRDGLYQITSAPFCSRPAVALGLTLEGAEEWAVLKKLDAGPNLPNGGFRFIGAEAITFLNYLKRDLADTERCLQKPKLTKAETARLKKGRCVSRKDSQCRKIVP